jgi:hypothetical protein
MKIITFLKRSKEKRAIKYAKRLRNTLSDLGYKIPGENEANCIYIWEHHGFKPSSKIEFGNHNLNIIF